MTPSQPLYATSKPAKPLESIDFRTIQEPLEGLLRNMDEDLKRGIRELQEAGAGIDRYRELTMLLIMLRFAHNSYQALAFLLSDLDPHPKRLPRYVLIVPAVNRQIMDLWFSLVYIMDDFEDRILLYEQIAYRQLREQIDKVRKRHASDPEWDDWFHDMEETARMMEGQVHLSDEQRLDPSKVIPSWPHSHDLSTRASRSQDFLRFLDEEIYGEVSIAAHLKPSGLMHVAGIVLSDIAPEHYKKLVEERTIHQYKFRNYFHTVIILLGIISEIEMHCKLGNGEQIARVWKRISRNADAKDIYDFRYKQHFP
jgi:hypothetical protein